MVYEAYVFAEGMSICITSPRNKYQAPTVHKEHHFIFKSVALHSSGHAYKGLDNREIIVEIAVSNSVHLFGSAATATRSRENSN